jgi:hypothetical protein
VLAGPIWLGDNSSVTKKVIERLYSCSHLLNAAGQYAYYGGVGGCLITGNEDGVKHCAMNILYSLQHLGYDSDSVSPCAFADWSRPNAGSPPSTKGGCVRRPDGDPMAIRLALIAHHSVRHRGCPACRVPGRHDVAGPSVVASWRRELTPSFL